MVCSILKVCTFIYLFILHSIINGVTYLSRTNAGEDVVFIANDWHTALLPCYLKTKYKPMGIYKNARVRLLNYVVKNFRQRIKLKQKNFSQMTRTICWDLTLVLTNDGRLFSASITLPTKGDFLLQTSLFSIFRNNLRALLILLMGMYADLSIWNCYYRRCLNIGWNFPTAMVWEIFFSCQVMTSFCMLQVWQACQGKEN